MKKDEITIDGTIYVPKSQTSQNVNLRPAQDHPFEIGKEYFIQTATHYYVGTVRAVSAQGVQLENAAWIPDTGRFNEFISGKSEATEIEPCGTTFIYFGGMIASMPRPNLLIEVQ